VAASGNADCCTTKRRKDAIKDRSCLSGLSMPAALRLWLLCHREIPFDNLRKRELKNGKCYNMTGGAPKVLFIGGTQFFGKLAVQRFLDAGWCVSVLSRGRHKPEWWDQVEAIQCDRGSREELVAALKGKSFDVVVDNIAFDAADVTSALEILRGSVGHYILTSSGAVYDDPEGNHVFDHIMEDDATLEIRPDDHPYAAGKKRAERAVLDRDIAFTVIRPTVVQGPHDPTLRPWFWIQRALDGGPVLLPDRRPEPAWNHAYSADVAALIVRAAGNPVAFGKAYNAAGGEVVTLADYLWTIGEALGCNPQIVRAPTQAFKERLPEYTPPFGCRFILDITRARADLAYDPMPAVHWIRETACWFAESYRGEDKDYLQRAGEVEFARSLTHLP
jgi:nucleoside-diphosphate-sugar epimerase